MRYCRLGCVLGLAVWARVPVRLYATLIAAPTAFLLLGLWPIVFTLTEDGITYLGWHNAAYVLARSVIGMAATMLFALTTPLAEILGALRFLPDTIVQLISLIYRFVGTLMVTAKSMWEAQHARLGYRAFGRAVNSAASQASSLFLLAFIRARALEEGLELRGDPARLDTLYTPRPVRWHVVAATVALFALIIWSCL